MTATPPESILTKRQRRKFGPKHFDYYGKKTVIVADVRYDDECGNGHNSFSITGEVRSTNKRLRNPVLTCGCIHEKIAQAFPELAPLIKWHLTSSDGPMHYPGNVTYHAGDRDCWGCLKGEPRAWEEVIRFGNSPISHKIGKHFAAFIKERHGSGEFQILEFEHPDNATSTGYKFSPNYTFAGYGEKWHECPFHTLQEAEEWQQALRGQIFFDRTPTLFGDGKARELDAARRAAVWPEATDEQLSLPKAELTALLEARRPALIAEFRAAVEGLGFTW